MLQGTTQVSCIVFPKRVRTFSETLSLRWEDIDWEMNRMSIPEPKVEHHEGRGIRSCPIFPGASTDPRRSLRDLRSQERIRGRRTAVSSGSQYSNGLEELESTNKIEN